MVDHLGRIVDGDQLLYIIAGARHERGELRGPVVGTRDEQSRAWSSRCASWASPSSARRSATAMCWRVLRETGGILGGETSGHILCLDQTTTGDGLVSALQVLAIMKQTRQVAGGTRRRHDALAAGLLNVEVAQRFDPARCRRSRRCCARSKAQLGERGRVVLRASGTEPVIRVMVEGRR